MMKTQTIRQGRQKVIIQMFDSVTVPHCVSTRMGGISWGGCAETNVAFLDHDLPECVIANRKLACAAGMLNGLKFSFMEQVHGSEVGIVQAEDTTTIDHAVAYPGVDALICNVPGITLMGKSADCPVILIHDEATPALAVVHSGWRGTLANIVENAINAMVREYGSAPEDMVAAISPCISFFRYEVEAGLIASFKKAFPELPTDLCAVDDDQSTGKLDLGGIVHWQLRGCGVDFIERLDMCTYDRVDLFYSHRRDGETTGRFGVFAQLPL